MTNLRNHVINTIKYLAYQINEHESNLQLALEKQATLETLGIYQIYENSKFIEL